jgi:hypothetical protein
MTTPTRPNPAVCRGQRPKDQVLAVVLTVGLLACPRAISGERTSGGAVPGSDPDGGGILRGWLGPGPAG